ncbi:MAG: AAA family ATPase [Nanoarchaeota archaeon]
MKRIYILGASGSGKSFISKKLSKILRISVYDLDDLFWKHGKERKYDVKRDEKERNNLLKEITKKDKWIIEGCYSSWIEDSIRKSDLVIWLDPSFPILAHRLILRFFKRKILMSKDGLKDLGLLLKYAKNYHVKNQPAGFYKHKELIEKNKLKFIYIKNKRELKKFLKNYS